MKVQLFEIMQAAVFSLLSMGQMIPKEGQPYIMAMIFLIMIGWQISNPLFSFKDMKELARVIMSKEFWKRFFGFSL